MPTIDLTPIFQAIIALLAALVTYKLIPWIKSKTTQQQQANLATAARVAVFAAEQIYGAGHGDEKLAYVTEALERVGFHLDAELLRESIEAAVRTMNGGKRWLEALAKDEEDDIEEEMTDEEAEALIEIANAAPAENENAAPAEGQVSMEDLAAENENAAPAENGGEAVTQGGDREPPDAE